MCDIPAAGHGDAEWTESFRPTACVLSNAARRAPTAVYGIRRGVCVIAAPLANVQPVVCDANTSVANIQPASCITAVGMATIRSEVCITATPACPIRPAV